MSYIKWDGESPGTPLWDDRSLGSDDRVAALEAEVADLRRQLKQKGAVDEYAGPVWLDEDVPLDERVAILEKALQAHDPKASADVLIRLKAQRARANEPKHNPAVKPVIDDQGVFDAIRDAHKRGDWQEADRMLKRHMLQKSEYMRAPAREPSREHIAEAANSKQVLAEAIEKGFKSNNATLAALNDVFAKAKAQFGLPEPVAEADWTEDV